MSRSRDHGYSPRCGLCQPHKRWRSNSVKNQKASVQRRLQEPTPKLSVASVERKEVEAVE